MIRGVMNTGVCKCCGQTVPSKMRMKFNLPAGYQIMVDTIHAAGELGIKSNRLLQLLYPGPNGGPDTGMEVVRTRIYFLNRHLKKFGWRVVGEHTGSKEFGHYRLVELPTAQVAA